MCRVCLQPCRQGSATALMQCCAGDALRPALMHAFGGLYLDLDVLCYYAVDSSLAGLELALQSAEAHGTTLNNGILASAAEHPLWLDLMRYMAGKAELVANPLLRDGDRILNSTGPEALTAVFQEAIGARPGTVLPGEHQLNGSLTQVYALGSWFQPCACRDRECQDKVDWQHIRGDISDAVVGNHLCLASWLTELKARNWRQTVTGLAAALLLAAGVLFCWVQRTSRRPRTGKGMRDASKA